MNKLLIGAAAMGLAAAACPEQCNGHGTCGANDVCTCFDNWQGASCGLRTCPYEVAWADVPEFDETAHGMAECANVGLCDRETGVCDCFPGYEGKGCGRQTCPSDCSGHGTCEYIDEMGYDDHPRFGAYDVAYTQWDAGHARLCRCDAGYEGADCSLRMCPRGDDALTATMSESNVQLLRVYESEAPAQLESMALLRKGWNRVDINCTTEDVWSLALVGDRVRFGPQGTSQDEAKGGYDLFEFTIADVSSSNITLEEPIYWGKEEQVNIHLSIDSDRQAAAAGEMYATYYDSYGGMWNTSMIDFSGGDAAIATNIQDALTAIPLSSLAGVTVSGSTASTGYTAGGVRPRLALANSQDFLITFAAAAGQYGQQHKLVFNVESHDAAGQWPLSAGITPALDFGVLVAEVTHEGTLGQTIDDTVSENAVCGNRGVCDESAGECQCFDGWRGLSCGTQEALV